MPVDPTAIIPSGKYIAIIDNNGAAKILERPNNKCVLGFDGDDAYWMDGTDALPIILPNMSENTGQMTHILGLLGSGRLFRYAAPNTDLLFLSCQAGVIQWVPNATVSVPTAGFGILTRAAYDLSTTPPSPTFLDTPGLVLLDSTGNPTVIPDGLVGQQLQMVGGNPTWANPPSGSVSSGSASVGLTGVSCTNTNTSTVSVQCPSLTLTDGSGNTVKATGVNVAANLAASLGTGGLDTGAEAINTWYYLYVISNGTTTSAVISTNGNSPSFTNLAGYTYFSLVSVFRNDGSGNIVNFVQRGRAFWTRPIVFADPATITTSFTAVASGIALTTILPPNSKTYSGICGGSDTANETQNTYTTVAADSAGMAMQYVPFDPNRASRDGFTQNYGSFFNMPVIDPSAPVIYWRGGAASNKRRVVITNYEI